MRIRIRISIDLLSLVPLERFEVTYPYRKLPGYLYKRTIPFSKLRTYLPRSEIQPYSYRRFSMYEHRDTGNRLFVSNLRRKESKRAKPLYLLFLSSYSHPLSYEEVYPVVRFFQESCNVHLRLSRVHLAMDLVSKGKATPYQRIIQALKPGYKGGPKPKLVYPSSIYFGSRRSSNSLVAYDKARQLREVQGLRVRGTVFRLEWRAHVPHLPGLPRTLDELAVFDWSFLYPQYFSFHQPSSTLLAKLRAHGEDYRRPLWELRDLAQNQLHILPSNFYTHYLEDHPRFSAPIRRALARYRWCVDSEKDKPP